MAKNEARIAILCPFFIIILTNFFPRILIDNDSVIEVNLLWTKCFGRQFFNGRKKFSYKSVSWSLVNDVNELLTNFDPSTHLSNLFFVVVDISSFSSLSGIDNIFKQTL